VHALQAARCDPPVVRDLRPAGGVASRGIPGG
jgi:hypothetical protein